MTRKRLSLSELLESEEDLLVLYGAEDDEDGGADSDDQDEDNDEDASGEDGEDSDNEDGEDGEDDEDEEDVPGLKARITALEKEKDRHFRKAAREKKRADALQAQIDGSGTKDKSKAKDEDSSESAHSVEVNNKLALQNAFLMTDTKHEFVNKSAAIKLLDTSDVDIDDDGTVDGMEEAIDRLAKDHPYLLKKKTAPATRKTGAQQSSQSKNTERSAAARKRELENRYPGLRNR